MCSGVNENHRHPSDKLCNIYHRRYRSAPGSYTSNQDEPLTARRDTILSLEMFGKHFSMFYTHTYNYLGGPKTGIVLHLLSYIRRRNNENYI